MNVSGRMFEKFLPHLFLSSEGFLIIFFITVPTMREFVIEICISGVVEVFYCLEV